MIKPKNSLKKSQNLGKCIFLQNCSFWEKIINIGENE